MLGRRLINKNVDCVINLYNGRPEEKRNTTIYVLSIPIFIYYMKNIVSNKVTCSIFQCPFPRKEAD